jgi:hypothetical protein
MDGTEVTEEEGSTPEPASTTTNWPGDEDDDVTAEEGCRTLLGVDSGPIARAFGLSFRCAGTK